jgi:hypothetical protein
MTGRWDRTPVQVLEQQVRDLTAQLEQARKATDVAAMRDMLSRAGLRYVEERIDDQICITVPDREDPYDTYLWFFVNTGQLNRIK